MNIWRLLAIFFFYFNFLLIKDVFADTDSLTAPVCINPEQIVASLEGNKIEYMMGEYQLNMSTIKGYLYNDFESRVYLKMHNKLRGTSYLMFAGGLGLVVTGFVKGKSLITLGGFSVAGTGLVFLFKSNNRFREAIHQYNKSICRNRYHP